ARALSSRPESSPGSISTLNCRNLRGPRLTIGVPELSGRSYGADQKVQLSRSYVVHALSPRARRL
ncbi:MAG: hypothetical protein OXH50_04120, partial [Gemmatimonadetes bacterium]|nr:hypothetical protein [Gemmatimonadota bacterium]